MENAIYYTFSTIPQTLAGAIALLGAFWIYKIDSINKDFISLGRAILRELGLPILGEAMNYDKMKEKNLNLYKEKLKTEEGFTSSKIDETIERLPIRMNAAMDQKNYKWVQDTIEQVNKFVPNEITTRINKKSQSFQSIKSALTSNTKNSIYISGVTIFLTVFILPFTEAIKCQKTLVSILFLFGLTFFGISLFKIIFTIINSLK